MNAPAPTTPSEVLATRPGWAALREAGDELHAAGLLIGDPLATPATAIPHLRGFWRAITTAASEARLAKPAGVDERLRVLEASPPPSKRSLRAELAVARAQLAALEPEVGGVPLYRRKQRIRWASLGVAVLVLPIAIYALVHAEVPGTGPWRAAYYAHKELEGAPVLVREDAIDHDWKDTAPHEKLAPDKYSVRWDTCVRIDEAGPVVFQVNANDGARVAIDGATVIDAWDKNPATRRRGFGSAELELEPGIHHLRVEFFESMGDAHIKLSASFDGSLPGPIPRERLSYPGDELDEQDPCAAVR